MMLTPIKKYRKIYKNNNKRKPINQDFMSIDVKNKEI